MICDNLQFASKRITEWLGANAGEQESGRIVRNGSADTCTEARVMDTSSSTELPNSKPGKSPAAKRVPPAGSHRRHRAALILLILALSVLACWLTLSPAWRETCRREAYLPQLEAEDRGTPFDGRLLALLGAELIQAHEYPVATETLRRAIAAGEQDPLVWLNLAAAHAAAGDPVRAEAAIGLGLKAHPDDPLLIMVRQRAIGLPRDASSAQLAAAIAPEGPGPLVARYDSGSFLDGAARRAGRLRPDSAGIRTCEEWAKERPADARVLYRWGAALSRSRRYGEATGVLERAVVLDPRFAPAHLALAQAMEAAGAPGAASKEYLEALKLRPTGRPP